MQYLLVIGGSLAAGSVPLVAYVAYKVAKARQRSKEARRRRGKKMQL